MDVNEYLRFQAALQSISDAIIGVDPAGLITWLNPAAERLLMCSEAAARGQHLGERCRFLQTDKSGQSEIDPLSVARENALSLQIEVANHALRPVELTCRFIGAPQNEGAGMVLVVRDISQQRDAEDRLREMYRQREEFLANFVHEIRSPMASVMGYAELLGTRLTDPVDRQYLNVIKSSGDYLLTLINDLVDLAKLEAGTLEIVCAPLQLDRLLNEVHTSMDSRACEKGLRLSLRLDGPLPESIKGDLIRVRQVLTHLISAVIKFADQGDVELIARHKRDSAMVELEIVASGISTACEFLIDPSMASADAATLRPGGDVLGLAIAGRLVELMGGTIACQSQGGKISHICVSLPASVSGATSVGSAAHDPPVAEWRAQHTLAQSQTSSESKPLNILLIDDNRVACKSMSMLLEMAGYNVRSAYDGSEALAIAQEFFPAVVISDIKLPDMGGFDLLRALRGLAGMEKTKFIALSGYAESEFQSEEPKFHHFLRKPVRVEQLELLLSDCVGAF